MQSYHTLWVAGPTRQVRRFGPRPSAALCRRSSAPAFRRPQGVPSRQGLWVCPLALGKAPATLCTWTQISSSSMSDMGGIKRTIVGTAGKGKKKTRASISTRYWLRRAIV